MAIQYEFIDKITTSQLSHATCSCETGHEECYFTTGSFTLWERHSDKGCPTTPAALSASSRLEISLRSLQNTRLKDLFAPYRIIAIFEGRRIVDSGIVDNLDAACSNLQLFYHQLNGHLNPLPWVRVTLGTRLSSI